MAKKTWGKVRWLLNKEDPDMDVLEGWYGPTNFALIEVHSPTTFTPLIKDPKMGEFVNVAIPYINLADLKRQLESFKEYYS